MRIVTADSPGLDPAALRGDLVHDHNRFRFLPGDSPGYGTEPGSSEPPSGSRIRISWTPSGATLGSPYFGSAPPEPDTVIASVAGDLAALKAAYPDSFLDVREVIVSADNPSLPQDVLDHTGDTTPTSLRVDEIHLTDEGNRIVTRTVSQFIKAKGWQNRPPRRSGAAPHRGPGGGGSTWHPA